MPNIVPNTSINIENELKNLSLYKYHPNGILNVSLNRLQDMLNGKVEITDPANPFVYLLETSSLNTAFAIQEYTLLTRKLYPRLANNESDLYLHMSDFDYLGRFAEPAYAKVIYNILFNDFKTRAHYDPIQKEHVLKLPRHFKLTVDDYIFTLTTAIIIRLTDNGIIDIKFENQDFDNIFPVETNFINFNIYNVNQEEKYINFEIKLPEIDIEMAEIPVEKSKLFKNTLTFNPKRKFYFFRAFYLKDNKWLEMITTHTDQVYDIYKPTCILKVYQEENKLEYHIPPVYINTDKIGTKVKFLIYTTKGPINVNFNDYKVSDFNVEYNHIFPETELDIYTEPLQLISKVIYIRDEVISGKDNIDFTNLKESVIDNSIGDRKLPITNKQIEFSSIQKNFKLIKDVDTVTGRVFLLECNVPNATTRYPISKINLDIIEYKTSVKGLTTSKNNIFKVNNNVTIIPESTVFNLTDDGLVLLDKTQYTQLVSLSDLELTDEVNRNKYLSTFYHYILDTGGNNPELRGYDISKPEVKMINFKEFNSTCRVGINTTNVNLVKTGLGFSLDVLSNLKKYDDMINESNIKPYIVYKDEGGSIFYLEGRLYTSINDNPVYRFDIKSNYYIDRNNKIEIQNFKDNNGNDIYVNIDLNSKLELIYISDIIPLKFVSSTMDNYIYGSYLSIGNCVVTLEELTVVFGYWLKMLYTRLHSSIGTREYEVWEKDVPMRYKKNVYNSDNTIKHIINEIVYDENNDIVYEYRKGDVKLDEDGNIILTDEQNIDRYLNMLFIDYKINMSNIDLIKNYRKYVRDYLTENIVENAVKVQDILLENTEGFVVVPKNLDKVKVKSNDRITYIDSMQSFKVNVYVTSKIYDDIEIKDSVEYIVIKEIGDYLYKNTKLNKTEILGVLYSKLKEFVISIQIEKFTDLNEEYIELMNENSRISFSKELVVTPEGYNIKENILINFKKV